MGYGIDFWLCSLVAAVVVGDASPENAPSIQPLPVALASFGAAVQDGWLYVAGGHVGTKHEHSISNLSASFVRTRVRDGGGWETLPDGMPLQSVSLVSDGRFLYQIGGMTAHNKPDQPEDLHSVDTVRRFDPRTRHWSTIPSLPTGRSSHDAVVFNGRLIVAGGWCLSGATDDARWDRTVLAIDLEAPEKWATLTTTPFERRAAAIAVLGHRLIVMGGIDALGEMSDRVDIFDFQNGRWSNGPALPSSGFGASAFVCGGRLYASVMSGAVLRLEDDLSSWQRLATLDTSRIFHRLVATEDGQLLFIGGANREGHVRSIESFDVSQWQTGPLTLQKK